MAISLVYFLKNSHLLWIRIVVLIDKLEFAYFTATSIPKTPYCFIFSAP